MMRKRFRKNIFTGWLFWFTLIAAFSLVGFSLAGWQDDLNIGGTATTGDACLKFTDCQLNDENSWGAVVDIDFDSTSIDLDIETTYSIERRWVWVGFDYWYTFDAFRVDLEYEIENCGSIPLSWDIGGFTNRQDTTITYDPDSSISPLLPADDESGSITIAGDGYVYIRRWRFFGGWDPPPIYIYPISIELDYTQSN